MSETVTGATGAVRGVTQRKKETVQEGDIIYEAVETDNRPDGFPEEDGEEVEGDLGFRDVVVEIEGPVESRLREVTLLSVALVETVRLGGSAVSRALGRRGDFEAAFVRVLVILSTSFWGSTLTSAESGSVLILMVGKLVRTGLLRSLGDSRSTWWFRGGGESAFDLDGAVLLEEGVIDRVDADLRTTGGDLTLGLRTTPEIVRLRTGVGAGDSLDLADTVGMGDFLGSGWRGGGRRCGDGLVL